jgi:hypothetical protein
MMHGLKWSKYGGATNMYILLLGLNRLVDSYAEAGSDLDSALWTGAYPKTVKDALKIVLDVAEWLSVDAPSEWDVTYEWAHSLAEDLENFVNEFEAER